VPPKWVSVKREKIKTLPLKWVLNFLDQAVINPWRMCLLLSVMQQWPLTSGTTLVVFAFHRYFYPKWLTVNSRSLWLLSEWCLLVYHHRKTHHFLDLSFVTVLLIFSIGLQLWLILLIRVIKYFLSVVLLIWKLLSIKAYSPSQHVRSCDDQSDITVSVIYELIVY